jgi:hypothetical protein
MRPSPRDSELARRLRASASVDQLLEMVRRQHVQLGTSESVAALAAVSQLSRNATGWLLDDTRMRALLERTRGCLADGATPVYPQDLVDIARSLANLRSRDALAACGRACKHEASACRPHSACARSASWRERAPKRPCRPAN